MAVDFNACGHVLRLLSAKCLIFILFQMDLTTNPAVKS